jgi:hypothetical protein
VDDEQIVRQKWLLLKAMLDERARRLWAGQKRRQSGEGNQHPDRNAQFEHINAAAQERIRRGVPMIEYRLFSFISIDWRGRPLRSYETVINLISNTINRGGLVVRARLDRRRYPIGKKVSKKEFRELNITLPTSTAIGTTSSGRVHAQRVDRMTSVFGP